MARPWRSLWHRDVTAPLREAALFAEETIFQKALLVLLRSEDLLAARLTPDKSEAEEKQCRN